MNELETVFGPPDHPRTVEWPAEPLLPNDFTWLVERYSDDATTPFRFVSDVFHTRQQEIDDPPLPPLLHFGSTEWGDTLFWDIRSAHADDWPVIVHSADGDWSATHRPFADYLLDELIRYEVGRVDVPVSNADLRAWAEAEGLPLPADRIPRAIIAAWYVANSPVSL